MRNYVIVFLAVVLAGCSMGKWVKDGATQQQVDQENYVCLKESQCTDCWTNPDPQLYKACMTAHGFRQTQ